MSGTSHPRAESPTETSAHAMHASLDGRTIDLAAAGITRFVHRAVLASTMDEAHVLAAGGAPSGTVVVADVQTAGRGRSGSTWVSQAGDGLWCTLVERAVPEHALEVLSLRVGMAIADVVAPWCDGVVGLKWPNDVLVQDAESGTFTARKLAGVLTEARWRDGQVDWVAIGVGINLRVPTTALVGRPAAALDPGTDRAQLLAALVPRLRDVARRDGPLRADECQEWDARDLMRGRACVEPAVGVVDGIAANGALCIAAEPPTAERVLCRSGSLRMREEVEPC